jgi:hypothetical protein
LAPHDPEEGCRLDLDRRAGAPVRVQRRRTGLRRDRGQPATDAPPGEPPRYSDQWLAREIVEQCAAHLRYVPKMGKWLVWNGSRWEPDNSLLAEDLILHEFRCIASELMR